jgi:hypothetical protein
VSNGPEWFAPKRFGYGSGPPIAWQGWTVLIGYLVIVLALTPLAERSIVAYLSLVLTLTALLMLVCRKTTGGWRWRSGAED